MTVRLLRLLFAPEIGRSLGEVANAARRLRASVRTLWDGMPGRSPEPGSSPVPGCSPVPGSSPVARGERHWRRLLERERRPRVLLGATLSALGMGLARLGMAGLLAAPAGAQTIDPDIFAASDSATRDLLGFLSEVDIARHAVLGDMLFVFNGGVLVLAGFLLLWHTVAGAVDTARTGRWGFGAWGIVRIVVAVALMAPLPGGMNGAQHAVVGLATLGGDFAGAVWTPFSEQALGRGDPIAPRPKAAAWRSAISRVLLAETCLYVANANARRIGDDPYVEVNDERIEGALLLRYDGDGRGMPRDLCGAVRFDGLDGEGSRGIAAHGHRRAMEGLLPAIRGLAADLGERFVPGSPVHGQPLPDVEAAMDARGLAQSYEAVLDDALSRAASEERLALERAVAEDAAGSSWLAAAGFFNTIASRTGLFQAAAHNVPDAALPLPSLEEWSPPAAAAVKGVLGALASSRTWAPVFFAAGAGVTGTLPAAGGGDGGLVAGLFEFIDLDAVVIADSGNPIADLAGFGHDLIASALGAIGAISGVAVGSGLLESIPFFGKGLDAFESVWRVTDGFVSTILGLMLIAGAVLAFVLPALPFIRFLFGVFGWLVNVVEAVLAVTVFAAAHVTRGQDRGLMVPATRQGWLFLPGLILRPPLMLFGLILGYFVFLAAIGLLNAIWLPQLRDAGASDGLGPIGFLAMLTLYTMLCYALMNGAFKLIDLLPSAVMDWIGGRAGGTDDGAGRLAGAVTGGIARAGSGRLTGRLRGGSGG